MQTSGQASGPEVENPWNVLRESPESAISSTESGLDDELMVIQIVQGSEQLPGSELK